MMDNSDSSLFRGHLPMVKLLINNGADCKLKTGSPCKSPMQLAAAAGHLEVIFLKFTSISRLKPTLSSYTLYAL